MNSTIYTINKRTSLRKFSSVKVSKEDMDTIINSALRAPTAGNMMFYSIIKVENKNTLEKLSVSCDNQPFIKSASFALIFLVDYQKMYDYFAHSNYFSYCKEQGVTPEFPELSDLLLGSEDAMCAAQNSVIAAESLGIGSCYIGDIIENYELHKELFNLQKLTFPLSMLVFGNCPEDYKPQTRGRFDRKFVVFEEQYSKLEGTDLLEMFSNQESKFDENNTVGAKNYAQLIYSRKFGSEFSKEMKRSVNVAFKEWLSYKDEQMKFY